MEQKGLGTWITVRFARQADWNRFVIDVRSIGTDAIAVESAGELELRLRASVRLHAGLLGMLFAHGGQVVVDSERSEPSAHAPARNVQGPGG